MNAEGRKEMEDAIRNASPLELAQKLQEAELYDQKETREVVDEIYRDLQQGGNLVDEVVKPVFLAIADGLLECTPATRKLRKKGLTASRVYSQCQSFSYDGTETEMIYPDSYTEWKNANEQLEAEAKQPYRRENVEDKAKLNTYKEDKFAHNEGRINATDEYTGQKNVYKERSNPDARRNVEAYKHDHQAEVDHIVPLKQVHDQLSHNYALTEEDIKSIANQDDNLALTSARINRGAGAPGCGGKFESTNEQFVADQEKREGEGKPNLGLSEEAKANMRQMGNDAQRAIEKEANKAVINNLTGKGTGHAQEIWGKAAGNAAGQAKEYVVGNVLLFIIKPLYYEIADIFKNGLQEGVNATSTLQALKIRFGRVKNYVLHNAMTLIKDNVWEFVKAFVSSLIEGIISLFVGIFKQIFKVVKEGIRLLIESGKVLFGKQANQMTAAEKGDAILKIIGTGVIAICGIGIEALLNKIGIMEPWSVVLSTMLSGIAAALFMLLLDKIDLFSTKAEKRYQRIKEIFDERIRDIQTATTSFSEAALETLRRQRLEFNRITQKITAAIDGNHIEDINSGLFELAHFMRVDLGYNNRNEFVKKWDNNELDNSL